MSTGHLDAQLLTDYAAQDRLSDAQLAAIEEHLFECEPCTARAEEVVQLAQRMRAMAAAMPPPVLTNAMLAGLEAKQRVQVVDVNAFEQRADKVSDNVDLVVTRIHCELAGVEEIDVALCTRDGAAFLEVYGAPFEAASGVVNVACHQHVASQNPGFRLKVSGKRSGQRVELADCMLMQDAAAPR